MEYRDNRSNISLLPRSVVERPNSVPVIRISSGNEFSRFSWPRRMKRVPFDPDDRHFRSTREAPILPHRVTMSRRQLAPESRNCRFYTSHFFLLFPADHSRGRSISAKATCIHLHIYYILYIYIYMYFLVYRKICKGLLASFKLRMIFCFHFIISQFCVHQHNRMQFIPAVYRISHIYYCYISEFISSCSV